MGSRGPLPEKKQKNVSISSGIPTAPKDLGEVAHREWDRIARVLHDHGLLTTIDRSTLAAYCMLYERWLTAEKALAENGLTFETEKGYVGMRPEVAIANKCIEQMRYLCKELGMTPNARGRMVVQGEEKADDMDDWEAEQQAAGAAVVEVGKGQKGQKGPKAKATRKSKKAKTSTHHGKRK